MANHKVLSTKKLESPLIEYARANGIEITEQQFTSIEPVFSEQTRNMIINLATKSIHAAFTSANAVDAVNSLLGDKYPAIPWKLFCLSGKTKEALLSRNLLNNNIVAEGATAIELGEAIVANNPDEVIFFCGNKRRDDLPIRLKGAGITVTEIIVYNTLQTPATVNEDYDAVLFFSPSGVQSFFAVNSLKRETACFAIGKTTADSISRFAGNKIIVSNSPSQKQLLASVTDYFKNINTDNQNNNQ